MGVVQVIQTGCFLLWIGTAVHAQAVSASGILPLCGAKLRPNVLARRGVIWKQICNIVSPPEMFILAVLNNNIVQYQKRAGRTFRRVP
ncbi:MAG: hypothetical protein CSA33_02805 [Desulfobulbus propionicus]|nr:MAG: hypothetical protein CSA33_02805 [Desulfobulbus propionicus]